MKAYHGDAKIKKKYLTRVRAHRKADQLLQGFGYWEYGKGCAVGCTIHGRDHAAYETELGIPRMVARLEDGIFEGLPKAEAQLWPERFLSGIEPGQDLTQVGDRFLHWLLVDPQDGVIRFSKTDTQRKAIGRIGELYGRKIAGEKIELSDWREARGAASAYSAADYAASAACAAYASDASAACAAYADASADYAASAACAAYASDASDACAAYASSAASAAYAAYAAYASDADSRFKARIRQSEKLLELFKAAPL